MAKTTPVTADELAALADRVQDVSSDMLHVLARLRKDFTSAMDQADLTHRAKDFAGLASVAADLASALLIVATMAEDRSALRELKAQLGK